MSDLLGIIAPLRKFLSDSDQSILIANSTEEALKLKAHRVYQIPDFQREIRWDEDNVSLLIDDLSSGSRYLGNVILTEHANNMYSLIDGQQRITILTMILKCIQKLHGDHIEVISPCTLEIESFSSFSKLINEYFPAEKKNSHDVTESDKLHQCEKYYDLWQYVMGHSTLQDRRQAQTVLENLCKSRINIILNKSDDIHDGIRYFIDVNLKGKQLDTEDIFKSYLFKNDGGKEIRDAWYQFKTNVSRAENSKMPYPLLKLLEHYFYCDLYTDPKYKGLEFSDKFVLKKEFKTKEENPQPHRQGSHLIEVIGSKQYMLTSMTKLNGAMQIMLEVVNSASTTSEFESLFPCIKENGDPARIDPTELKIIHNFMKKLLKDSNLLPKALLMKYILTTLLGKTPKFKSEYQKIYGVYLLSVLFTVFENTKSKDILLGVLKSDSCTWYDEAISQIKSYFSLDKITDNRLLAQYKYATNYEEEDYRFRCKSLATIYNFFMVKGDTINIRGKLADLNKFINDDSLYSMEHFIISESDTNSAKIVIGSDKADYQYESTFFKKYVNSMFNFIFIPQVMNSKLKNYWLPQKLEMIAEGSLGSVECSYSIMVIEKLKDLSAHMKTAAPSIVNCKDSLDLYFHRDFKEHYVSVSRAILKAVIERIKTP